MFVYRVDWFGEDGLKMESEADTLGGRYMVFVCHDPQVAVRFTQNTTDSESE